MLKTLFYMLLAIASCTLFATATAQPVPADPPLVKIWLLGVMAFAVLWAIYVGKKA